MAKKICQKCHKEMEEGNFYTYRNGEKTELCKKCLTMHIDNFDPSTFLWLCEKLDVPYIEAEWNVLRDRAYAKDPTKMNGMSVFGKYIAKMKLKQWKQYTWADTERLAEEAKKAAEEQLAKEKEQEAYAEEAFAQNLISEAQYKTLVSTETQHKNDKPAAPPPIEEPYFFDEDYLPDFASNLTEDDKIKMALKWGRYYKPSEWVELEKTYTDMENSFDIQDADTRNTLILLCKTNLKMNQALDSGDIETYKKLSTVSDSLRKSAKFTAAQNKEKKEEFVDSVGQIVYYCEKWGGQIPRFKIEAPQDIIDTIINDNKQYIKNLFYQDTALARQMEDYLKKREIAEQQHRDMLLAKSKGQDYVEISDADIIEHQENLRKMQEESEQISNGEADE